MLASGAVGVSPYEVILGTTDESSGLDLCPISVSLGSAVTSGVIPVKTGRKRREGEPESLSEDVYAVFPKEIIAGRRRQRPRCTAGVIRGDLK